MRTAKTRTPPTKSHAARRPAWPDHAALVKTIYAAFGRGDIARVIAWLAEDVEWFVPGAPAVPYAGARRGKAQVAEFFDLLEKSVVFRRFEPRDYIAQGDKVAVTGYDAGTVKSTGIGFEEDWVMVWTFARGRVAMFREYMDTKSVIEAFKT